MPVKVADKDEAIVAKYAGAITRYIGKNGLEGLANILNKYLNSINYPKNKCEINRNIGFRILYHKLLREEKVTELMGLRFKDNKFSLTCLQSVDFGNVGNNIEYMDIDSAFRAFYGNRGDLNVR